MVQQQHLLQQRQQQAAARQAMMAAQQFGSGMPMDVPNGMGQMNAAQYQAMRGGPNMRPVALPQLPQHLQQQQQQAQIGLAQEQAHQAQQQQVMLYSNVIILRSVIVAY